MGPVDPSRAPAVKDSQPRLLRGVGAPAALAAEVGRLDALIPQLEKELKVQAIALPPQAAQRKQAEIDRHRARRSELLTSLASACATQPAASCEALKVQR